MSILILFILLCFTTASSYSMDSPTGRLVVNGSVANIKDHPYVVKLYPVYNNTTFPAIHVICHGTLIAWNWVLTAAHCLLSPKYTIIAAKVVAGISDVSEKGQANDVEMIICHADYSTKIVPNFRHDICLAKTVDSFEYTDRVRRADLPLKWKSDTFSLSNVTGFGKVAPDKNSPRSLQLLNIEAKHGSKHDCQSFDKNYNEILDICMIGKIGGPCFEDSGTGFVSKKWDNIFVILGVLSASDCKLQMYGPRVSNYIDWIIRIMNEHRGSV